MIEGFVSKICDEAVKAVDDYAEMSGCDDWRAIPESWVQSSIARNLHAERLSVLLEVSTDSSKWSSKLPNPLSSGHIGRDGHIDILVFGRLEDEDRDEVWCGIEVKASMSGWSTFANDLVRLKELVTSTEIRHGLLVYVSCQMSTAALEKDRADFAAEVGIASPDRVLRTMPNGEQWRVTAVVVGP